MPSAALALQQAIFTALSTATPITALLGGPHVFDDVPQ